MSEPIDIIKDELRRVRERIGRRVIEATLLTELLERMRRLPPPPNSEGYEHG